MLIFAFAGGPDYVDLWPAAGWGWAMWNFTGPMGIIDSDRADVEYENWHSHKVAREMLTLAQGWKVGLSLTAMPYRNSGIDEAHGVLDSSVAASVFA